MEAAARETGRILIVEEHNVIGGLGTAVAETAALLGLSAKIAKLGINDQYVLVAPPSHLYRRYERHDRRRGRTPANPARKLMTASTDRGVGRFSGRVAIVTGAASGIGGSDGPLPWHARRVTGPPLPNRSKAWSSSPSHRSGGLTS